MKTVLSVCNLFKLRIFSAESDVPVPIVVKTSVDDKVEECEDFVLNVNHNLLPLINELEVEIDQDGFLPGKETLEAGRKCRFFNKGMYGI